MRVHRRYLYTGLFLIAIGGMLVAADLGAIDTPTLADALRLWPIAIVAFGLGLVVRRTRFSLPAGMLAAAVPGIVLGGALAVAPRFAGDCGARVGQLDRATHQGTFDGPARVTVRAGCGSITVGTTGGNAWRLDAASTAARQPNVVANGRSLAIDATTGRGWNVLDGRDDWNLTLPTSQLDSLSLSVIASRAQVGLGGAQIGNLALTTNASAMSVDASSASIQSLSAVVNVGALSIRLPSGHDLTGSLRVGGGAADVCAPAGLGLRVTARGFAEGVTVNGLHQTGANWQSPDYESAPHRADLTITTNFGGIEINPIGGCK
jgi:hypothetical protein